MAISFISFASAESTSISSMPSHQAGDLLVIYAFRTSSNAVPTTPSGWTTVWSNNTSGRGSVVGCVVATSESMTSGTWTNAEGMLCVVYRDSTNYCGIGAVSRTNGTTTTTIGYSGSILPGRSGTSPTIEAWHVSFGGCNSNSTDFDSAPAGMTNRGSLAGTAAFEITAHDTNATSSSWSNVNRTNSSSVSYHTFTLELFDTGIAKTASGGGGPLVGGRLAI